MTSTLEQFHVQCGALRRRLNWTKVKQEKPPTSGDKHRPPPVPPQQNERSNWTPNGYNFNDLPTSRLLWRPRKDLPPIPPDNSCSSSSLASKWCSRTDAGSPDHIYEEIPFFTDHTRNYDSSSVNPTQTTLSCTCEKPDAMPIRSVPAVVKLKPKQSYLPSPIITAEQLPRKKENLLKTSGTSFELESQLRTSDSKLIRAKAEIQLRRNTDENISGKDVQSNDGDPSTSMQCNENDGERARMTSQNCLRKSPQCSKLIGSRIAIQKFSNNNYDTISTELERENISTPINSIDVTVMDRNNVAFEDISDVTIGNKCDVSKDKSDETFGSARDAILINKTDVSISNISDATFWNRSDVIDCHSFDCAQSSRQGDEDIQFSNEVEQILVDLDASLNRNSIHLCGQSDEYDNQFECSDFRSSPDNYVGLDQIVDHGTWSAPDSTSLEKSMSPKEKDPYHKRRGITGMHYILSANSRIPEELENNDFINPEANFRINTNLSDSQDYCNYTTLTPPSSERLSCRLKDPHTLQTTILDRSSSRLVDLGLLNASGSEWTVSGDRIIGHNRLLEALIRKNFDRQTFLI